MQEIIFHEADHQYFHEGRRLDGVTGIIDAAGMSDYRNIPNRQYYLDRGKCVHAALRMIGLAELGGQDLFDYYDAEPDCAGFIQSGCLFLDRSGFRVIIAEYFVFDPILGVAGQLDVAMIGGPGAGTQAGTLIMPDWKCTEAQLSTAVQIAAYDRFKKCLKEPIKIIIVDGPRDNWIVVREFIQPAYEYADREHKRCGVALRKDGKAPKVTWYDNAQDFELFMAALSVARFNRRSRNVRFD